MWAGDDLGRESQRGFGRAENAINRRISEPNKKMEPPVEVAFAASIARETVAYEERIFPCGDILAKNSTSDEIMNIQSLNETYS